MKIFKEIKEPILKVVKRHTFERRDEKNIIISDGTEVDEFKSKNIRRIVISEE